jgi:predicted AlkP superfamily phosphohydrolase/phosphomutase
MRIHLPFAVLLCALLATALGATVSARAAGADEGRVIILGFDGADAQTIEELVAADPDRFPTFRRLMAEGSFAPAEVVVPPESPVSWAAINTGQNPAKTGVPGFVRRDLGKGNSAPMPALGHIDMTERPLEYFDGAPLPTWSAKKLGLIAGGAIFLVVLLLGVLLMRGKVLLPAILALLLGGGAGWGGFWVRGLLPENYPRTENPNQARNIWDYAAEAGVISVAIDPAQAFDMPETPGAQVLAGLGLPDAKGAIGDWAIYTTDPDEFDRPPKGRPTTTAGTVFRVDERGGQISTRIFGPQNFWEKEILTEEIEAIEAETAALDEASLENPGSSRERRMTLSDRRQELRDQLSESRREGTTVPMEIEVLDSTARVTIDGKTQELSEGEWSEFFELTFQMNWLLEVRAITRVKLVHLKDPHFELFVNVLDLDPRHPPFWQKISTPIDFSGDLAHRCGLYETYGWPTATMPFKDGEVEPELLMEDVEFTMQWRENLIYDQLGRDDWRFFMGVFSTTDRVQHMMYQYWDEQHPLYNPEIAAREMVFFGETIRLGDAIPAIYAQMDRIMGRVLDDHLVEGDTLIVCSDHGFQSCRHQVNINNWLYQKGYLAVKSTLSRSSARALMFVDWENTRAYSLGMGFVYLNLEGREFRGQVGVEEYDSELAKLREEFLAEDFVDEVYIVREIHEGPHINLEADMILGFAQYYRVSWGGTSGGLALTKNEVGVYEPGPILEDNDSPWSGGHVSVALPNVQGVFFSNRRVQIPEHGIKALQIAPTALSLLGVPIPEEMDLGPLSFTD